MKTPGFPTRTRNMVGMIALLALLLSLAGALFPLRVAGEPTPRPTPTTAPYIELYPTEAIGQQDLSILVTGYYWTPGGAPVTLYWDVGDPAYYLAGPINIGSDGRFQTTVTVRASWATPGGHEVLATTDGMSFARASIGLIEPTATPTPTDSPTPPDSPTPAPTTPSPTPTETVTPTPSPTLRPITPVPGTGTPSPPPGILPQPPVPTSTQPPRPVQPTPKPPTPVPPTPVPPTATYTPSPTPTDTPTLTPTPTPTDTPTLTPTPTDTPTPTPTDTPTSTPTPTFTPTPAPALGTPLAPVQTPGGPSTGATLPGTGGGWESVFFQGFVAAVVLIVLLTAFIVVVMVTLLVAWRIIRMRQAQERYGG